MVLQRLADPASPVWPSLWESAGPTDARRPRTVFSVSRRTPTRWARALRRTRLSCAVSLFTVTGRQNPVRAISASNSASFGVRLVVLKTHHRVRLASVDHIDRDAQLGQLALPANPTASRSPSRCAPDTGSAPSETTHNACGSVAVLPRAKIVPSASFTQNAVSSFDTSSPTYSDMVTLLGLPIGTRRRDPAS